METYLFTSALADFVRLRRVAVWLLVAGAFYLIGVKLAQMGQDQTAQDTYVMLSSSLVFHLLPLAAAIFSTAVMTQEVEQKTIVYLLTRPIPRWKLVVFRTLAAIVVVFLLSALGALAISAASYGGRPLQSLFWHDLLALAIGSVAYTSLFVLVSLLVNRSMIICLLFAFGWETSIPNIPGDLRWLSVNSYLASIANRPPTTGQKGLLDAIGGLLAGEPIPTATAWIVLAGLCAFCFVAGAYWFSVNEYVPREDAE